VRLRRHDRARRTLSVTRLVIAIVVVLSCVTGAALTVRRAVDIVPVAGPGPWFAPYVDVTATPEFHFEDPSADPAPAVVLGFIVAPRTHQCLPTWGTYYDLDHAADALDMDRRIARLRDHGGDPIVSFGGAANDELALDCSTAPDLEAAYSAVIHRYDVDTVDFDIEGAALDDAAANTRRAVATKQLQDTARSAGRHLAVWLTLPVAPNGMSPQAIGVIDSMLRSKVDVAGVNLMTMDYGASLARPTGGTRTMVEATSEALNAAAAQIDSAFRRSGIVLDRTALWQKIGMTPMIGQNDVQNERISIKDAIALEQLAIKRGVGRVSMWSLNRDAPCGAQLDLGVVSDDCSGIEQRPLAFSNVFDGLRNVAGGAEAGPATVVPDGLIDDPAHSPYPIWSDDQTYRAGDKVTWHHNVYQAKWWSQQNVPDDPVAHEWDTPWQYLGPVMPGDVPTTVPPLPKGTYPAWHATTVYVKGDRVQVGTTAYEANWWTQGDHPDEVVANPWDSPWVAIGQAKRVRG
jgi:chitinase